MELNALKKCKQLLEYQDLLLLSDNWWFNFNMCISVVYFFNASVFRYLWQLKTAFSYTDVYYALSN